jgi:hypothetical protein
MYAELILNRGLRHKYIKYKRKYTHLKQIGGAFFIFVDPNNRKCISRIPYALQQMQNITLLLCHGNIHTQEGIISQRFNEADFRNTVSMHIDDAKCNLKDNVCVHERIIPDICFNIFKNDIAPLVEHIDNKIGRIQFKNIIMVKCPLIIYIIVDRSIGNYYILPSTELILMGICVYQDDYTTSFYKNIDLFTNKIYDDTKRRINLFSFNKMLLDNVYKLVDSGSSLYFKYPQNILRDYKFDGNIPLQQAKYMLAILNKVSQILSYTIPDKPLNYFYDSDKKIFKPDILECHRDIIDLCVGHINSEWRIYMLCFFKYIINDDRFNISMGEQNIVFDGDGNGNQLDNIIITKI